MGTPDLSLLKKALGLKKTLDESDLSGLYHARDISELLVQLVDFQNPFRQMLPRRPGQGEGYVARTRTSGTTLAEDVDDTDSFAEDTGSYNEVYFAYKTIGTQGKVTRRVQKTGRLVSDMLADEMQAKAMEMRDREEHRIIWGNQPTINTKQIQGLQYQMYSHTGQIVGSTTAGTLTLTKMDETLDKVITTANPSVILTSRAGARKINAALQAQQRFVDKVEVPGGFQVMSYNGVPIIKTTNIPDTLTMTSGGTVSSLTGGSFTCLFAVDFNHVFMSVLEELTMMPLARRSSQFVEFDIFEDLALVTRDYRAISQYYFWAA